MYFNTCIGQPAENEAYFPRPYLDDRFWKYVQQNSHIIVSAPRRVGKTSFLKSVNHADYHVKYLITQAINRQNDFFKRLYKSVLEELSQKQSVWSGLGDILKKNRIEKIGLSGISIKGEDLDYYEEFRFLIYKIDLGKPMVLVIDEFSETLENIITDQGDKAGQMFLNKNRELRLDDGVKSKVRFVYTGSIGLGNIAARIGATKSINDCTNFEIPPFSKQECDALINLLTANDQIEFKDKRREYLYDKVNWLIPYYLQIILDEIDNKFRYDTPEVLKISIGHIDLAIEKALKVRDYFEHWHTRLRTAFKGEHYTFAIEALNLVAKDEKTKKVKLYDLAVKYDLSEHYATVLRSLEYDGYIYLTENNRYVFNSPLLRMWWLKNVTI